MVKGLALSCPACGGQTQPREGGLLGCTPCKLTARPEVIALLVARHSSDREAGVIAHAARAIAFVLDQLQRDADTYRVLGFGTEGFRLLCCAEAAVTGRTLLSVENVRAFCSDATLSTVERLTAKVSRLEYELTRFAGAGAR